MRTLKLQVQATVDGFMAGPNGEMDWMTFPWTADISGYVAAIGNGMPAFGGLDTKQFLTLVHANAFDCGIVVLTYLQARTRLIPSHVG